MSAPPQAGVGGSGPLPRGPLIENIPPELKDRPQWVAYTLPRRSADKVPVNPRTGKQAKTNKPETWGTFVQAVEYWQAHQNGGIGGIGFVFSPEDPYCGVDLGWCRDPETGEIEAWARDIIGRLNSYTEVSPSGQGVHIILRGTMPGTGRKVTWETSTIELRGERFFFAMTGDLLAETPTAIKDRKRELSVLYHETLSWGGGTAPQGPGPSPDTPEALSQEGLVQLAGTLRRQGRGETSIRWFLGALNRASASPLEEGVIGRTAKSVARKPPGLTGKGDPEAARRACKQLGGQDKSVRYTDLVARIMKNQECSEWTAKESIRKAIEKRYLVGPGNGFKGYKIRKPSRR